MEFPLNWDDFVDLITVVWLIVFAIGLLFPTLSQITNSINIGLLSVFIADLYVGYKRVGNLKDFLRKKWVDVLLVIPYLRVLRMLRVLRVLRLAKAVRSAKASKGHALSMASHLQKALKVYKKARRILRRLVGSH